MKNCPSNHHYPLKSPTGKWTLASTIIASAMAFIDGTALNVVLPTLQNDLNADGSDLFWVLNSYLLMLAALIIIGGSLGDKLGRVKVFKVGIAIFTIGSILCGLAPNILSLIIFRAIQGIGGAFMIPGSLAIISATFASEEKGKAIGSWSAITTVVTVCGPVLGGALADLGLWRFIFFINIPLGLASYLILHFNVPESKEPGDTKIDWTGAIVLTVSLAALTYGFLGMPEWGYSHWVIICSLSLGLITLIAFIFIEKRVKNPMVPLSLFKNSTFSGVNLLSFFLYAGLGAMMLFLSLNIIQIQGYSQLQAGLTFLPFSFLMITIARYMGGATDKYGARPFLIFGPFLTGVGMLWLANIGLTNGPSDYWTTYFPPFLVFAIGMSITVVPLTTAVMSSVSETKSGIASGINNSVTRISGTFINAILGAFAVLFYINFIELDLSTTSFTPTEKEMILKEGLKLGDAKVPNDFTEKPACLIGEIYKSSFIKVYRLVGILSASLAFLSSAFAIIMVRKKG